MAREQEGKGHSGTAWGNLNHPSAPKPAGNPLPPSAGRIWAANELCPGAVRTCTPPSGAGSQSIPVEARPTPLAVITHRVVEAAQTSARHGVTVPHGVEIHVPVTVAGLAGTHGTSVPQGVPEKPIITELAAFSWERWEGGEDPAVLTMPTAPVPTQPQPHLSAPGGSGCRPPPHCWAPRCRASGRGRGRACNHQSAPKRGCRKSRGCSARRRDPLCCASTGSALRGGKRS